MNKTQDQEWLENYQSLRPILQKVLSHSHRILNIGCGNSSLSSELYQNGFKQVTNIDFSEEVISHMEEKHRRESLMIWKVMDCRKLNFWDKSFDFVIDKGTLDILLSSPQSHSDLALYFSEVERVLKDNGFFLVVSASPSIQLLHHFKREHLDFEVLCLSMKSLCKADSNTFVTVCVKGKLAEQNLLNLPLVLEKL